ncbi:hypothetical protein GOP47_0022746 [Adiantum capillus-veneris]|uniref:Uncharacterized protein n=1 Tax=Adiantum capillus-veneris TaxID=13818 RepID=A0A9D4U6E1_ADICA|nr:hypothetical protein GOP47_0022746 [Adiantum capillus-veneris]
MLVDGDNVMQKGGVRDSPPKQNLCIQFTDSCMETVLEKVDSLCLSTDLGFHSTIVQLDRAGLTNDAADTLRRKSLLSGYTKTILSPPTVADCLLLPADLDEEEQDLVNRDLTMATPSLELW